MSVETIVWKAGLYGLPAAFTLASLVLGFMTAGDARRWVFAAGLIAAWVALMLVLMFSGVTRVHGPDPAFIGLVFVTPVLLVLYALGLWTGRRVP